MGHRYPQPDNEDDFEQFCLRYYRRQLKRDALTLYGKRGEKQDGVDIFDPLCNTPITAIQCKHYESTKTIPPADIQAEVKKAEAAILDLNHYIIATTAKKSRNAQDTVVKLNSRTDTTRKFTVEVQFWEDICERIGQFDRAQAEIIVYGSPILTGFSVTVAAKQVAPQHTVRSDDSESPLGESFALIERLFTDRRIDVVRHELGKMPLPEQSDALPSDERYQIFRFHAKLALEEDEFENAGRLFLEAFQFAPDLEQAKANQVLGLNLTGRAEQAHRVALQYADAGVNSAALAAHLVRSCSSSAELEEHQEYFELFKKSDEGLNVALSHKLRELGQREEARTAAYRAIDLGNSPQTHFSLALVAHNDVIHGPAEERVANLELALKSYESAFVAANEHGFDGMVPEILVNRATAKALSGDAAGAAEDYRRAVASRSAPNLYAEAAIKYFLAAEDFDSARQLLDSLDLTRRQARYLRAVTEYQFSDSDKRRLLIEELAELADAVWEGADESRFFSVQWALLLEDFELASSFVTETYLKVNPFCALTIRAWISAERKEIDDARENAAAALKESSRSANPQILSILAKIFVVLEDDENAIVFLEQVATPGVFDVDMRRLIDCANRLNRHDLLLRLFRELREAGVQDERARKGEIQLLERYNPEQAFELASTYADDDIDPAYFVAYRNVLAIRLKKQIELVLDSDRLPKAADLSSAEAGLVVYPYTVCGMYRECLRFIYGQLRSHFDDESAHARYVFYFLECENRSVLTERPDEVQVNVAVQIEVAEHRRWFTIEHDGPLQSRGEFASTHEFAAAFIGKSVGETVQMPGSDAQPQTAEIVELQCKYVRTFQDCMSQFRIRFPESSVLQQISCGEGDDFDPEPLIKTLKDRKEFVDHCMNAYANNPVPLFLLADRVGVSELDAMRTLANRPDGIVRCSSASPDLFENLASDECSSDVVVMDASAIVTLSLLNAWERIPDHKILLVSQGTVDQIDMWVLDAERKLGKDGGHACLDEQGQVVLTEATDEDHSRSIEELRKVKSRVESRCQRRASESLAELSPKRREMYVEAIGFHHVESVAIARDEQALLWTDDSFLALIAAADFGVVSVWTQLVLRRSCHSGDLSEQEFDRISAKLVGWRFVSTIWRPETVIAAGAEAEWEVDRSPFRQCIAELGKSTLPIRARSDIVGRTLKLLRRSECIELKQSAVVQAMLSALGDANAVRWLHRNLNRYFLIDIISSDFVRQEIQFWLRLR